MSDTTVSSLGLALPCEYNVTLSHIACRGIKLKTMKRSAAYVILKILGKNSEEPLVPPQRTTKNSDSAGDSPEWKGCTHVLGPVLDPDAVLQITVHHERMLSIGRKDHFVGSADFPLGARISALLAVGDSKANSRGAIADDDDDDDDDDVGVDGSGQQGGGGALRASTTPIAEEIVWMPLRDKAKRIGTPKERSLTGDIGLLIGLSNPVARSITLKYSALKAVDVGVKQSILDSQNRPVLSVTLFAPGEIAPDIWVVTLHRVGEVTSCGEVRTRVTTTGNAAHSALFDARDRRIAIVECDRPQVGRVRVRWTETNETLQVERDDRLWVAAWSGMRLCEFGDRDETLLVWPDANTDVAIASLLRVAVGECMRVCPSSVF